MAEEAFSIVRNLATELSLSELRLPSLPETVVRIRNALASEDYSADELAKIMSAEPALVGSVLSMANSVAFQRSGNETTDLRVAISRIGAGMVRNIATQFALRQLRAAEEFKEAEHLLAPQWSKANRIAATAFLLAQKVRGVKPDEALVLGMMHNIGRIYLYSRAPQFPSLYDDPEQLNALVDSWHAGVAKAIVESWHLPDSVVDAVSQQDEIPDDPATPAMCNLLTVSLGIDTLVEPPPKEALQALAGRIDCRHLGLPAEKLAEIVANREETRQDLGLS